MGTLMIIYGIGILIFGYLVSNISQHSVLDSKETKENIWCNNYIKFKQWI